MGRTARPRKAYRPGCVDTDPVETAIALAARLLPSQRRMLRQPLRVAFSGLLRGTGGWPAWCAMADAMNVAEQLALRQICSDRMPEIEAAQAALHALHTRHAQRNTWTLRPEEITALRVGRFFHFVQLNYATQGELRESIHAVQRKVAQALAGNASPSAKVCVGGIHPSTATNKHASEATA